MGTAAPAEKKDGESNHVSIAACKLSAQTRQKGQKAPLRQNRRGTVVSRYVSKETLKQGGSGKKRNEHQQKSLLRATPTLSRGG